MGCHLKATARLFIILHLLIGDVLPMEGKMLVCSIYINHYLLYKRRGEGIYMYSW